MKFAVLRLPWHPAVPAPAMLWQNLAVEIQAERQRWILWAPVGMGLGIWVYFALPFEPPRLWLAAAPLLAVFCALPRLEKYRPLLLAVLLFALGCNAAQMAVWRIHNPMLRRDRGPITVAGRVIAVDPKIDGVSLQLDELVIPALRPEQTPRSVRIRLREDAAQWPPPGSRIAISARLTAPREPVAPGAWDFRRHAWFAGIGAQGFARSSPVILEAPQQRGFMLWVESLRAAMTVRVLQRLSGDAAQITTALLNGAQSGISKPALEAMRASGLQHILSISGLHLAIAAAFSFVGLRSLLALWPYAALYWPIKKIAAGLSLFNLIAYTLLVGAPLPAVRSAAMTGLVMIAIMFDRRALSLRTVALTAMALLVAAPQALLNASFQMSFAAVTVMVAGYEALRQHKRAIIAADAPRPRRLRWLSGHIGGIIFTSVLAGAATTPFTLYNFQQMNWYGIFANMLALPLTSFWIMPAGFIATLLMPFGLEGWAVQLMGAGVRVLMALAEWVGGWPGAAIYTRAPPALALPLMLFGGLWLCLWQRRWRLFGLAPLLLGAGLCFMPVETDIYIAPDFANWAVRQPDGGFIARKGGARNFTLQQWRQREGGAEFALWRDVQRAARRAGNDAAESDSALRCDPQACLYKAQGRLVSFAETAEAVQEDCLQADLVITPLWHVRCADAGAAIIDGAWIKYHGAISIRLDPVKPAEIRASRPGWGTRPWMPGWKG